MAVPSAGVPDREPPSPLHDVVARIRRVPCKLLVATVLFCLSVGEWYPFSNFPMYAQLFGSTWYVQVTDGSDQPVATMPQFGTSVVPLKRIYAARLKRLGWSAQTGAFPRALAERAGAQALEHLVREANPARGAPPLPDRLRLWRTDLTVRDSRIERERVLVAEISVR